MSNSENKNEDEYEDEYENENEDKDKNEYEEYKKLDLSWITNFELIDNGYNRLYKDDLKNINIRYIYLDNTNEIKLVKYERIKLSNLNFLSRNDLSRILKNNSFVNDNRFKILSLIKYNINLEPENLNDFLKNPSYYIFLSKITNIDDIKWEKSIKMFEKINELIIIFYINSVFDKDNLKLNTTKKIYLIEKKNINKRKKYNKTIKQ